MTLRDIGLKKRIARANGSTPEVAGKYLGWKPSHVAKRPYEFSKQDLLDRGWSKDVLEDVAEAYEVIARITPANPSAAGRAKQLRNIVEQCFK